MLSTHGYQQEERSQVLQAQNGDPLEQVKSLQEQLQALRVQLENTLFMSVPQRIGCTLVKLWAQDRHSGPSFVSPVSKATLSLRIGIQQETFSRAIPKLKALGVHMDKKVTVFEPKMVKKGICDHCSGRDSCQAFRSLQGC